MSAVQLALQENNLGHAIELVNKYFPKSGEPDLRGIEWRYLWNLCQDDESFVLDFHGYPVNAAACSPDGKLAALASFDNKVTVVERDSKQVLARLNGFFNTHNAQAVAFSPDGLNLAVADGRNIHVFATANWNKVHTLTNEALSGYMFSVPIAFSPDGKILSCNADSEIRHWDTVSWAQRVGQPPNLADDFGPPRCWHPRQPLASGEGCASGPAGPIRSSSASTS